jgi:hypothetical protein
MGPESSYEGPPSPAGSLPSAMGPQKPYGVQPYGAPPGVEPPLEADEAPELAPTTTTGHLGPRLSNLPVPLPRPRPSLAERSDEGAKAAPVPDTSIKAPETVAPAPPPGSPPQSGAAVNPPPDEKRDSPAVAAPAARSDNPAPAAAPKPVRPPPPVIND